MLVSASDTTSSSSPVSLSHEVVCHIRSSTPRQEVRLAALSPLDHLRTYSLLRHLHHRGSQQPEVSRLVHRDGSCEFCSNIHCPTRVLALQLTMHSCSPIFRTSPPQICSLLRTSSTTSKPTTSYPKQSHSTTADWARRQLRASVTLMAESPRQRPGSLVQPKMRPMMSGKGRSRLRGKPGQRPSRLRTRLGSR